MTGDPDNSTTPSGSAGLLVNTRGALTNSGLALPGISKSATVWFDYDNDGDLDLLVAGQAGAGPSSALTRLFRNDNNGSFVAVPTVLPGVTECSLAVGDYDNDGWLDVALSGLNTSTNRIAAIYRNLGNGTFTNSTVILPGVSRGAIAWGDYDNDGFADLVLTGLTNSLATNAITRIFHNDGGGLFTDANAPLPGIFDHSAAWGDYDNDGDLDLLLGARIFRNIVNAPSTPPSAPTNLTATILANNEVLLAWSRGGTSQTSNAASSTFNLRVGTNAGGGQVMSPQASAASGYHRVPNLGNAGTMNFWQMTELPNGTYFWSVQEIDSRFAGSAFATEASFTLSRPIISAITNRSVAPDVAIAPIPFTVSDGETVASNLIVTVSSSDTNLVPLANLALAGSDTNRSLTVTPATNRSGSVTLTITAVNEGGQGASRSFILTVERFGDIAAGLTSAAGPVAWGDFDGDGDLDLVKGSTAYRNLGSSVFTNLGASLPFNEGGGGWGDFDNDGNLDLLTVGANACRIYRTDGQGNFIETNVGLPAAGLPRQAGAWGDYDNDGDQDILLSGGNFTRLYRNNGTSAFTNLVASLPSVVNGAAVWADYDNDGDLDLLLAGSGLLRVYRNNGNGTFSDLGLGLPGLSLASAAWGDFDNDGYPDFAVGGSGNNTVSGVATRIYRNAPNATGTGRTFTNLYPVAALGPTGIWKGAVAWGDYDNDGDPDLLVTGESTNGIALTKLYRNDGGSFVDSGHSLPALKNSFAAWGDFDRDGHLDLALSGLDASGANVSRIYRNFPSGAANVAPSAPGGLTSLVVGKSVRLTWTAAADANQAAGLSYNLRVGSSPGVGNVVSPLANVNGTRLVAALGNVGERLTWTITNLTGGIFYWSVQAVDAAFAGSAFAAEQSFVISNRPPVATIQSTTLPEDTSKTITLTGSDPDGDPLTFSVAAPPLFGQLTGTSPTFSYRPLTNYFGFDQFTFRANDRMTDSVPAAVFIEITPVDDVAAPSLGIQPRAAGEMQLSLFAEPWRSYRLEASEDLVNWVTLTNFLCTNLLTELVDADAPHFNHRFYRPAEERPAPQFTPSIAWDAEGLHLLVAGEVGRNYQVQSSSNLVTWTILTNVLQAAALTPFLDRDATRFSRQFYRLVSP